MTPEATLAAVVLISAGMESGGSDRGPGSVAAGASLIDVWSAERRHGEGALLEVALRGEPERRVTALRALRCTPLSPALLARLLPLTESGPDVVHARQVNADGGVYDLHFEIHAEARKTFAAHARPEHAPLLLAWLALRKDRAVCASDPDLPPIVHYATHLARLAPDDEAVVRALADLALHEKTYGTERVPILLMLARLPHSIVSERFRSTLASLAAAARASWTGSHGFLCIDLVNVLATCERTDLLPEVRDLLAALAARAHRLVWSLAIESTARAAVSLGMDAGERRALAEKVEQLAGAASPRDQRGLTRASAVLRGKTA